MIFYLLKITNNIPDKHNITPSNSFCFNFSFRNIYPAVNANIGAELDKIVVHDPEFTLSDPIHMSIEDVINKLERVRYFNSFKFVVLMIV